MNPLQAYLAFFPLYFKDKLIKINLVLALGLNVVIWLWLFWKTRSFSGHVALHYNIYFGIDAFGPWFELFYLPGLGLGIFLLNLALGAPSFEREKNLGYFLATTATFSQAVLGLAVFFITFINS